VFAIMNTWVAESI